MDRCALFVDAGYLLANGAMAVHGTRHRETVSWDFGGLLQLLSNLARERTGMPLLRCYWYEATVEGRRAPEHDALADLPGLKLRLGRIRPGRREGVDSEIHRDLMTLARNGALADAVVVSGDEDLAQVVSDAQDLGLRVTVVHVAVDGNWTISRVLRQECERALDNPVLGELLLDAPTLMGVESIEVDTVTLRMVARTLPGKQFEAGRQLRVLVVRALARSGIGTAADAKVGVVGGPGVEAATAEQEEYEKTHEPVQR